MALSSRLRLLLIISAIILILVIAGGAWWLMQSREKTTDATSSQQVTVSNNNQQTSVEPVATNNQTPTNTIPTNQTPINTVDNRSEVLRLARTITERYGSYSNRNNFENITTLEPFMTERFKQESLAYIDQHKNDGIPAEFYGISTNVLSLDMVDYQDGKSAVINVSTQRIEVRSNQDPKRVEQVAQVAFEQVDDNWKVDSIRWE